MGVWKRAPGIDHYQVTQTYPNGGTRGYHFQIVRHPGEIDLPERDEAYDSTFDASDKAWEGWVDFVANLGIQDDEVVGILWGSTGYGYICYFTTDPADWDAKWAEWKANGFLENEQLKEILDSTIEVEPLW